MRSVKSTTLEKIIALRIKKIIAWAALSSVSILTFAQGNSPYSRYGLGDLTPNTNIVNRGMGSVAVAYADPLSVNFTNPASYSNFLSYQEQRSKKSASGRVLFDVGLNFDNQTLREGNTPQKFNSSNAIFSYMQLGLPLKKNWGLNFGLRQLSRITYKIDRIAPLYDPLTNELIDSSVLTRYNGDGGAFLASAGTGFAIHNLRIGLNFGYLFGKKESSTQVFFLNDSVRFNPSKHNSNTSYGNIFVNAGLQYKADLSKKYALSLGFVGNFRQTLNASQDFKVETFTATPSGDLQIDSVYEEKEKKGKIIYPSSFGFGLVFEKKPDLKNNKFASWMVGVDFLQNNWNEYRFFGSPDFVRNNWELRLGTQIRPEPKKNYFSNVAYRGGIIIGQDYIHVEKNLPLWGLSFGMGLPLANYNRLALGQASVINLALEFIKRGNNDNLLKENIFRFSVGLSLSDLWFVKRKYE